MTFQRKKSMRTDMPGLAEQRKVGRSKLYSMAILVIILMMFSPKILQSEFHGRRCWF
jgi:hypothetical protein